MNKEKLDIEIDKIYEIGDEMFIPNTLVTEVFGHMITEEVKKHRN